jgi:hypothetical protein
MYSSKKVSTQVSDGGSKQVSKQVSKKVSKAVSEPVFRCPGTPRKPGKTPNYSITSIKYIKLPGDQVSTCVMEFADETDENYDPYKVFQENMDDIKTMNGRDVNLMLLLRGLSIDGTITDKKHRLRNTFYIGDSPAIPTRSKVTWSGMVIVRNNLVDIDTNFTYRTTETQHRIDEMARRCMLCPKRPAISFGPGCCQQIDPSFRITFHSLRPDLNAAPGLIEDIHQTIIDSERVTKPTADEKSAQKQLASLRTLARYGQVDGHQILKDRHDLNNYLSTVCSW